MVDVGGGRGALLAALLAENRQLHGILFDLAGVVVGGRENVVSADVAGRWEVVSGDFRDSVPPGGDVYLLSWVLHDWDDQTAQRILVNCRAAMEKGARLLVVEMVIPESGDPAAAAFERLVRQADLEMLAVVGGRERREGEFRELLAGAGFSISGVQTLEGLPWSVLDARAV
jgi:hypothetical protein